MSIFMDLKELKDLLNLLKKHKNIIFFEIPGKVSLKFHHEQPAVLEPKVKEADKVVDIPVDENSLPPDLRTDNITDYDKLLNWSASPEDDGGMQIPLTGDAPIEGL